MFNKETDTHIAGKLAIWLGLLFTICSIVLAIINVVLPNPLSFVDLSLAFLVAIFTLLSGYLYGRIEHISAIQQRILGQPNQGVEIFTTADDLLARLSELTVGARYVVTLNLSPPHGATKPLDEYFKRVHRHLSSKTNCKTKSFRTLAHVSSLDKGKWVVDRSFELLQTGRFSQAIFDSSVDNIFPMGFHAIENGGQKYVFFYPGVSLSGVMRCFLIKEPFVFDIVSSYFEQLWNNATIINEGKKVNRLGLEKIKLKFPNIEQSNSFQELFASCDG